jgi:hypothetical protein
MFFQQGTVIKNTLEYEVSEMIGISAVLLLPLVTKGSSTESIGACDKGIRLSKPHRIAEGDALRVYAQLGAGLCFSDHAMNTRSSPNRAGSACNKRTSTPSLLLFIMIFCTHFLVADKLRPNDQRRRRRHFPIGVIGKIALHNSGADNS